MTDETTTEAAPVEPEAAPEPAPAPEPDRRDPDLYNDQVPPHAPGVDGNVEPEPEVEHGTSADGTAAA